MKLQKKLKKEAKDLNKRIEELYDFTQSEKFNEISQGKRSLILFKLDTTRAYWRALNSVISDLQRNNAPKKPEPPKDIVEKGQSFD